MVRDASLTGSNKRIDVGRIPDPPSRNKHNVIDQAVHEFFNDYGRLLAIAVDHTLWTRHLNFEGFALACEVPSACINSLLKNPSP